MGKDGISGYFIKSMKMGYISIENAVLTTEKAWFVKNE
jgi:hypothetical protein